MPPIPTWSGMDGRWNTYGFSAQNCVSFLGGVQQKSIEALIGKVMAWFIFGHVSITRWACVARRGHASFTGGLNV